MWFDFVKICVDLVQVVRYETLCDCVPVCLCAYVPM